jgi:hypothetical protein
VKFKQGNDGTNVKTLFVREKSSGKNGPSHFD